jgi:hypothetical protein
MLLILGARGLSHDERFGKGDGFDSGMVRAAESRSSRRRRGTPPRDLHSQSLRLKAFQGLATVAAEEEQSDPGDRRQGGRAEDAH